MSQKGVSSNDVVWFVSDGEIRKRKKVVIGCESIAEIRRRDVRREK